MVGTGVVKVKAEVRRGEGVKMVIWRERGSSPCKCCRTVLEWAHWVPKGLSANNKDLATLPITPHTDLYPGVRLEVASA